MPRGKALKFRKSHKEGEAAYSKVPKIKLEMRKPKSLDQPDMVLMRSPFGYRTEVMEKEVDSLIRLGWEIV